MTTQSNINSPIEVAPRQHFSWSLALVILIVGILLGVFASNLSLASTTEATVAPQRISRDFPARPNLLEAEKKALIASGEQSERAIAAEAARYTSLGLFYAAGTEVNTQQAAAAEMARYNGLAGFYGANIQRATAAETARYNGLAGFYGATKTLAWPQRPTQFQPADTAVIAENNLDRPHHDREYGLAAFETSGAESHPLAWPPRPTQFHGVKEAGINDDMGLMEVSAIK